MRFRFKLWHVFAVTLVVAAALSIGNQFIFDLHKMQVSHIRSGRYWDIGGSTFWKRSER